MGALVLDYECSILQSNSKSVACPNIQVLIGGFETKTGEQVCVIEAQFYSEFFSPVLPKKIVTYFYCLQWLAFKNDGKYTAAGYAQVASEKMSKYSDVGGQKFWNPFEKKETIKRRRYFVTKLLQGAIRGLVYMHERERLHQSLGPASVSLKYVSQLSRLKSNKINYSQSHLNFLWLFKNFQHFCFANFSTIVEKDAAYLVPRLRDLAFSVDIRHV